MNRTRIPLNKQLLGGLFMGLLALMLLPPGRAGAQTLAQHCGRWSIVPSPNPGGGDDLLGGVSSVPGSHILWAVGWTNSQTLIERWNGGTWKAVSSPSPGAIGNGLRGSRLAPLVMCGPSGPITQALNSIRSSPSSIVSCNSLLK